MKQNKSKKLNNDIFQYAVVTLTQTHNVQLRAITVINTNELEDSSRDHSHKQLLIGALQDTYFENFSGICLDSSLKNILCGVLF